MRISPPPHSLQLLNPVEVKKGTMNETETSVGKGTDLPAEVPENYDLIDGIEISKRHFSALKTRARELEQSGYHQRRNGCGCALETRKGAYRDTVMKFEEVTVYWYHQSPIVIEHNRTGLQKLDNHGYRTSTTKERLNRYVKRGYSIKQRDYDWLIRGGGEEAQFSNGYWV